MHFLRPEWTMNGQLNRIWIELNAPLDERCMPGMMPASDTFIIHSVGFVRKLEKSGEWEVCWAVPGQWLKKTHLQAARRHLLHPKWMLVIKQPWKSSTFGHNNRKGYLNRTMTGCLWWHFTVENRCHFRETSFVYNLVIDRRPQNTHTYSAGKFPQQFELVNRS